MSAGCEQSISHCYNLQQDGRPNGLCDCLDAETGELDIEKYKQFLNKKNDLAAAETAMFNSLHEHEIKPTEKTRPKRKKRSCKSLRPYYCDTDGNVVHLKPRQTVWCLPHVKRPLLNCPHFQRKFRRRFRVPHPEYTRPLERVRSDYSIFGRWLGKDAVGNLPSPLSLLLLGALRYLGRGLTFDDLEEHTAISEEVHRIFFHQFILFGSTRLHKELVIVPATINQYNPHTAEYKKAGVHGCGFSTDATNVIVWRCEDNLKQMNTGFKSSHPARTCNITVNHKREILHSTEGHPSRWNDKTLACLDEFLCPLHDGKILSDFRFILLSWSGTACASPVIATTYTGAWGIVDNGHHKWTCTQAPAKDHPMRTEERFSEWLESMRKDVECVFGTLKGRFRALKTGIRLEGAVAADRVWLACCALHNWLLHADGLSSDWENGVPSDYEGELGDNEEEEWSAHAPFAISRLNRQSISSFGSRGHERAAQEEETGRRHRDGDEEQVEQEEDLPGEIVTNSDGSIQLRSLSCDEFRRRLVKHFDILFHRRQIQWPRRNGTNDSSD